MSDILQRAVSFELRDVSDDGRTLSGYAAVFDSPTLIHERGKSFMEQLARGAFAKAINNRDKVVLQFDHGQHPLIGSMPLGRINELREDDHGLWVNARLSDNWLIQPVRDAISDLAVDGMSFRFSIPAGGDVWDRSGDIALRTITEVRLYELGPVVFPAYADTSVAVRSAFSAWDPELRQALIEGLGGKATPDEGQPTTTETPDEGHRTRTRNQRRALAVLHTERNSDG
jgi:HK97 family phage prohead protease